MNLPSIDIKDIIEANSSLSLVFKTDLFLEFEPSEPDNCVTIRTFDEGEPVTNLDTGDKILYHPGIQVRVRNNSSKDGWELARDIRDVLNNLYDETWNGANYRGIFVTSGPIPLGQDDNNRFLYTVNFNVHREKVI